MGLLDNIQNFGKRVRTASQPFLDVYNTPEFQQQITLGTSLLSGAGVPASIQAANQAGLLAQNTQNLKRRREAVDSLLATGGFTNTEKSLITASSNPVATALSIRNSKQPKGTDATALMKNYAFFKSLKPDASDEEIFKAIRGGTTTNINIPNQSFRDGDFIFSTDKDGKVTATVIPGSESALEQEAAEKKLETLEEKQEKQKESKRSTADIVLEDIDRAKKIIKDNPILTTGIFGNLLKDVGAIEIFTKGNINPATDLAALLSTIQANIGFDRLDRMRQESPTGGALGQVAVKELDFLQATLGSLSQSQSSEQLIANLERLSDQYKSLIRNLANSKEVDEQGRSGVEFLKNYGFTDAQIASATGGGATEQLGVKYIDGLSKDQLLKVDPYDDNLSDEAFERYLERRYQ